MAQVGKIEWEDSPSAEQRVRRWTIVRAPEKGKASFLCLSGKLVGCRTHFFGNRTVPCLGRLCAACEAGKEWEWHGYLACVRGGTKAREIVEIRGAVGGQIHDEYCKRRSLRGMMFSLRRNEQRSNGRVVVDFTGWADDMKQYEEVEGLRKILCTMWRVDERYAPDLLMPQTGLVIAKTGTDVADVAPTTTHSAHDQSID